MQRCLDLAKLGAGNVAPNPMVGAVLVYDDTIIGEGWHRRYGEAHAEVNCINQAIQNGHSHFLQQATLFVSLEPCMHFGKTPPCTDLIIKSKISRVVIGCRDPFNKVNGKGVEKLIEAGINVVQGILENECKELNKRFFTFHTAYRPYVILKWAQTADGFIAASPNLRQLAEGTLESSKDMESFAKSGFEVPLCGGCKGASRLLISNEYTNRLVHQWRSEETAILIGTNTALHDNPELTVRAWPGNSPVRLVVDMDLRLPLSLKIFDRKVRTIIFNTVKHEEGENLQYYQVTHDTNLVHQVVSALHQLNIQSVLVEGGVRLLQSFIDEGIWDELRTISNRELAIGEGLSAPVFGNVIKTGEQTIASDNIDIYKRLPA